MATRKKITFFIIVVCLLFGCNTEHITRRKYDKLLKQSFLLTPDSLLTREDILTEIRLNDYIYSHFTAENNRMKLLISKKNMESYGIPAIYYDIVQYQIRENNSFIDKAMKDGLLTDENFNCEEQIKEAKERYWSKERPLLIQRLEN